MTERGTPGAQGAGAGINAVVIKKTLRGCTALTLALALVPLVTAAAPARALEAVPLADAVELLPVVMEDRTGYTRSSFKHWTPD